MVWPRRAKNIACEKSRVEEVWRMWRQEPWGQQMSFYKAMGRRMEVKARMAQ